MFILITKRTRDESYYWSSINKEKQMKKQLSNNYGKDLNSFELSDINKTGNKKDIEDVEAENIKPVIYADSREGSSRVLGNLNV